MRYAEYAPHPALAHVVRCIWTIDAGPSATDEIVIPDGCMELIIHHGDPCLGASNTQPFQEQGHAIIAGQLTRPFRIRPTGSFRAIGVRFNPTGFASCFREIPHQMTEQTFALDGMDSRSASRLTGQINDAATDDERIACLQDYLFARLSPKESESSRAVNHAAYLIAKTNGHIPIDQLAQTVRLSHRHLERLFLNHVGVSPKMLCRIVRFRSVFDQLTDNPEWSRLAAACGYFDQAHLIRDFNRFAGQPPRAYLQSQSPMDRCMTGRD